MTPRNAECGVRNAECRSAAGAVVLTALFALSALAADGDSLRAKQLAQEKARAMAGELVSAVLDIQLRQLEENGLASLPIYRDIASMKEHLGTLMKDDMEAIVQLLVEAQEGSKDERLATFDAARERIRDVVVQLMAERQRLYRRMKLARLSADARQLIDLQTKTHDTTRSLPERRPDQRERLALATIEDQADVRKLYYQLVASLADVATWGGQPAAGASDGLRILKAAQVEPELKRAGEALGKADFAAAAASQQVVLKGLAALLEKLDETQGIIDGDRESALRMVREALRVQQDVRERTKLTVLTERTTEPLIEAQTGLQKELSKLAIALTKFPTTEPLVEQAKAASFEATASLFEEKKSPALDQQGRVIGSLAQIEKVLEQGSDLTHASQSADELAAEVSRLEQLKAELDNAGRQQTQATETAAAEPQMAAQHENQVAETLKQAERLGDFPSAVESRLGDANERVAEAQIALQNSAANAAPSRQDATDAALDAIKQAQAEVES